MDSGGLGKESVLDKLGMHVSWNPVDFAFVVDDYDSWFGVVDVHALV
jgi:hypothetical protein